MDKVECYLFEGRIMLYKARRILFKETSFVEVFLGRGGTTYIREGFFLLENGEKERK